MLEWFCLIAPPPDLPIPVPAISGAIPAQDQGFTTALWE